MCERRVARRSGARVGRCTRVATTPKEPPKPIPNPNEAPFLKDKSNVTNKISNLIHDFWNRGVEVGRVEQKKRQRARI